MPAAKDDNLFSIVCDIEGIEQRLHALCDKHKRKEHKPSAVDFGIMAQKANCLKNAIGWIAAGNMERAEAAMKGLHEGEHG